MREFTMIEESRLETAESLAEMFRLFREDKLINDTINLSIICHSIGRIKGFWNDVLMWKNVKYTRDVAFKGHIFMQLCHLLDEYIEFCEAGSEDKPEELADCIIVLADLMAALGYTLSVNDICVSIPLERGESMIAHLMRSFRKYGDIERFELVNAACTLGTLSINNNIDWLTAVINKCEKNLTREFRYGVAKE